MQLYYCSAVVEVIGVCEGKHGRSENSRRYRNNRAIYPIMTSKLYIDGFAL